MRSFPAVQKLFSHWPQRLRPGWPLVFLITALWLHFVYLDKFNPLHEYWHAPERYLHIAALAEGSPDGQVHIPVKFLGYVLGERPEKLREYDELCPHWKYMLDMNFCQQIENHSLKLRKFESSQTVGFIHHFNPASYPPLAYLPYVLAAKLAKVLDLKPRETIALLTDVGSLTAIAIGYFAIRLLPAMRMAMVFFLLVPAVCTMRIYPMPDGLLISAIALFVAGILHFRAYPGKLTPRSLFFLSLLALWIAYAKLAYFCVAGLAALLPPACFGTRKRYWGYVSGLMFAAFLTAAGWAWQSGTSTFDFDFSDMLTGKNVHGRTATVYVQLERIFAMPEDYLLAVANATFTPEAVERYITLGWNRPNLGKLSLSLRWGLFIPLLLLPMWPIGKKRMLLRPMERAWCLVLFYGGVLTILTLNYLFIDYGRRDFDGLRYYNQGRYFLPLLPLLMLILSGLTQYNGFLGKLVKSLTHMAVFYCLCVMFILQKIHLG